MKTAPLRFKSHGRNVIKNTFVSGTKNQQNVEKREQGQDCNKDLLNVGCK